jgi:signal transduction histidine kinase
MNHADLDGDRSRHLQQRLHDGLGQCLSLAVLQIDQAEAEANSQALQRTRALLREALRELRSLISSIGQSIAGNTEPDLPSGLNACVRRLNALQATPVSCTIEGLQLPLSEQACEILLGATRELLINACKHGQAARVDARLSILPHRLSITVTERPTAADAKPLRQAVPPGHGLGLRTTRRELSRIGARLRWRNGGPDGVQARISWVPS